MNGASSKYSVEIYDPFGNRLATLNSRATNRKLVKIRNDADQITWSLNLDDVDAYCAAQGIDVASLFINGRNEVRIRRGSQYLSGGQLIYWQAKSNSQGRSIDFRALGFFNLLAYRFTSASFTATDACSIAWQLINQSQQDTNGDFGIRQGVSASPGLWNKSYDRTSLKDAIQGLANSPTRGFDFEVAYDKKFNMYAKIGSDRSKDIRFDSPGNIIEWTLPNDATGLANEVIGIGQGNGTQAQTVYTGTSTNSDAAAASQLTYAKRQKFLQLSSTDNADQSLTDAVNGELAAWAFPFEIPSIIVDGNIPPYITDYGIGDVTHVRLKNSAISRHINGGYRIEQYELDIDENDDERISLSLSA